AFAVVRSAHRVGQLDVTRRGDPAARMHVVVMKAVGAQPDRPASVEAVGAGVPPTQRIATLAHARNVVADRRIEGTEQRANGGLLVARQIADGFGAMAQ